MGKDMDMDVETGHIHKEGTSRLTARNPQISIMDYIEPSSGGVHKR